MSQPDPIVAAAAILENKVDLRAYPYRYLTVRANTSLHLAGFRQVMAAAEMLSYQGWDLVSISEFSGSQILGVMCRRA
jgi:hypothetical protein